jgi:hypothetical protein
MKIYMSNVEGKGKHNHRALTRALPYRKLNAETGEITNAFVERKFVWNGSSVPFGFNAMFPRHRHPVASCRHDKRCGEAKTKEERKFADEEFKSDVSTTSWKVTSWFGYLGVRAGAMLGIGSNF